MFLLSFERDAYEKGLQGYFGWNNTVRALTLARAPSRTCLELLESVAKAIEENLERVVSFRYFFGLSRAILAHEDSSLTEILLRVINRLSGIPLSLEYNLDIQTEDAVLWELDGPCDGRLALQHAVYLFEKAECKHIPAYLLNGIIRDHRSMVEELAPILPEAFFKWIATNSEMAIEGHQDVIAFEMLETLLRSPAFAQGFLAREELVKGALRALEVHRLKKAIFPLVAMCLDLPHECSVRQEVLGTAYKVLQDSSKTAHSDRAIMDTFYILYVALHFDAETREMIERDSGVNDALQRIPDAIRGFWRCAEALKAYQCMSEYMGESGASNKLWSDSAVNRQRLQASVRFFTWNPRIGSDALPVSFWRALMQLARDEGTSFVHALCDNPLVNVIEIHRISASCCDPNERDASGLTPIRALFSHEGDFETLQFFLTHPRTELDGDDGPFLKFFQQYKERIYQHFHLNSPTIIRKLAGRGAFSGIRTFEEFRSILPPVFEKGWHRLDLFSTVVFCSSISLVREFDAIAVTTDDLRDRQPGPQSREELEMFCLMLRRYVIITVMCCASERASRSDLVGTSSSGGPWRVILTKDFIRMLANYLE